MPSRPKQLLQAAPRVADPASVGLISPNLNGAPLPRLDTTAAIQPAMGMARIGEGVERLGEAATRLYEKKEKADSVTAEMRSAEVLENAYQKIAIRTKEEQDQSKWQSIGEEELNNAQAELDKIPNVPPEAKQAIQHKYNMASLQVRGGLKTKAIEKSFQDADKSADAIIDRAGRTENMQLGVSTIDGMVASGLWPKEVGEDRKVKLGQHVEQTAQERQKNQFLSATMADPQKALEIAKNPNYGVTPEFRAWAQHTASTAVHTQQLAQMDAFQGAIFEGMKPGSTEGIKTEKDIDPWIEKNAKGTTEKEKQQMHTAFRQQTNVAHMEDVKARAPEIFSDLWSRADAVSPETPLDQIGALKQEIGELPVNMRAKLNQRMDAKWIGHPPAIDKSLTSWGQSMLNSQLQDQVFGKWKVPALDDKGKVRKRDDGSVIMVRDQKAYQAALTQKAKVGGQFHRWAVANPKTAAAFANGDPAAVDEASKALNGIIPNGTRAGWIDRLRGAVTPYTVPPGLDQPAAAPTAPAAPVQSDTDDFPEAEPGPGVSDIHAAPGAVPSESLRASLPAPLKPHADDFKDAADETGLDPRFLAAISMFETGNGTSRPFRNLNNAMGISDKHGATAQSSVRDSIFKMARSLANPKGPYRKAKTVDEIAAIYSPPGAENDPNGTNSEWPDAVKRNLSHLKKG